MKELRLVYIGSERMLWWVLIGGDQLGADRQRGIVILREFEIFFMAGNVGKWKCLFYKDFDFLTFFRDDDGL